MSFENAAGLGVRNHYGERKIVDKFGGQVSTSLNVKEVEWVFSYDDLPSAVSGGYMEAYIPKGAVILSAKMVALVAFAGGTSYDIGLEQNGGTAIDADGLFDGVAVANLNVVNEWADSGGHTGALVGSTVGLTHDGFLLVVATGTFTAGKAKLVVEYREADFDASARYVAGGVKG